MSIILNRNIRFEGKWLRFVDISFQTASGSVSNWESIERCAYSNGKLSSVEVLPLIYYPVSKKETEVVLVRQFRPPASVYSLELPAGLIDGNEGPEIAAHRELAEETGFQGSIILTSPIFLSGPSVSASRSIYCVAKINGDAQDFVNEPEQNLEETEDLSVVRFPLNSLYENLVTYSEAGGSVEARLFSLALGIFIKNKLSDL
ncbi:hypothetical protein RCL1_007816 [Eukaryota sp. TZLM3-RCL]